MTDTILDPKVEAALKANNIEYKVLECDPDLADTAAFCEHYNFKPEQAANTILVASKKVVPVKYAVCVILATTKLDVNKKACQLLGVKRGSFADAETTTSQTGMMIGGVTAIGITDLPIYIDASVMVQQEVVTGGGNRSSKVLLNPNELKKLPSAEVVEGLGLPR